MQPNQSIQRITAKELTLFFTSPVAYLFLGTFAAVTLFVFFWGETFFSRNIADVRPLFEWMPILLIFLSGALTMRLWSEERRSGTLEHILTQPVAIWKFVLAKFMACFILLLVALVVTLPLPMTVSMVADLDWGPVLTGYLATLMLGSAYISIGLFVSSRSDNQVVSLISATALCGLLYLVGAPAITDFFGNQSGEWLRAIGTGSRFDDITRGVIDVSDLAYYMSLVVIFLVLNTYSLERERWANTGDHGYHLRWNLGTLFLVANAVAVNLWLGQLNSLRIDTTEGRIYSISDATEGYLNQLQEPLLIRGYFSAKTHPLLAPLVPQIRDLINEYAMRGNSQVRVEFIDPMSDPEAEEFANQRYGIQPVPFQVSDRYSAAVVNSYFDVLIEYGDEYQVLGFRDLIEIKSQSEGDIDVLLRNPEYDISRAIRKVLLAYQSGGNLFDTVKGDLIFNAYVSADDKLPEQLVSFKTDVRKVLEGKQADAGERFKFEFIEPEADGGQVAQQIGEEFGFKPMVASLFDRNEFYFYLTLGREKQVVQLPLGDFSAESFEKSLDAGIKRFASGFTKTVALVAPQAHPQMMQFGVSGPRFSELQQVLGEDFNIKSEDLKDGAVDAEADVLLLAAPKDLDDKQLFAVDQFLMRGGTVIAVTSPFSSSLANKSLSMQRVNSGLQDWLKHHGLTVEGNLVLDPQNSAFPVPVTRQVGMFNFQEIMMIDYPYFVDLRGEGLNEESVITRDLNQLSMAWASPITVDEEKTSGMEITRLLSSSDKAWLSNSLNVMPQLDGQGLSRYEPTAEQGSHLLAMIAQGGFASYFAGKQSPLLADTNEQPEAGDSASEQEDGGNIFSSVIEKSAESARIILFASNDFVSDQVIQLAGAARGSESLGGLQLLANTVDWAVEEQGLLSIRSRGHFNRTLPPMAQDEQILWEIGNYLVAILLILILAVVQHQRYRRRNRRYAEQFSI